MLFSLLALHKKWQTKYPWAPCIYFKLCLRVVFLLSQALIYTFHFSALKSIRNSLSLWDSSSVFRNQGRTRWFFADTVHKARIKTLFPFLYITHKAWCHEFPSFGNHNAKGVLIFILKANKLNLAGNKIFFYKNLLGAKI